VTAALEPGVCVVCRGEMTAAEVGPGDVTCSQHFLDALFPEEARQPSTPKTCDRCGWPFARTQPDCAGPHRERV
jgi:hypothetical protein